MDLIIVESPAKARTIKGYLGNKYQVLASYGHVRDLPKTKTGVAVDKNYQPTYRVPKRARKHVNSIKKALGKSGNLYLATDLDREGEAIAWHLVEALKLDSKSDEVKRIIFDEVTKTAIKKAIDKPTKINMDLVDAQQARRVLDRLVGYNLSPFLWKKISRGLSAGRVQSVTVRLIVDRERKIEDFKPTKYWQVKAKLAKDDKKLIAKLDKIKDKKVKKFEIKGGKASKIEKDLKNKKYLVDKLTKETKSKYPYPPYTTATLQRDASFRLGFPAKKTMFLAQKLYEGIAVKGKSAKGLITYMRTDSVSVSKQALKGARGFIKKNHSDSLPAKPVNYRTKSKGAQEAHEAIRPTDFSLDPNIIKDSLNKDQFKLYQLIWNRMISSQMKPAKYDLINIEIKAGDYGFAAKGQRMVKPGFSQLYPIRFKDKILPELAVKDELELKKLLVDQKETQPPTRYTESSLIKELEKRGIGRPSTYAPTLSTIQQRNYVEKMRGYFHPTEIGEVVNDVLVEHFPKIVDYNFTADVETDLDEIAKGGQKWTKVIDDFYKPFNKNLKSKQKKLDTKKIAGEEIDEKCPDCGNGLNIKFGRFGKFIACSNYPDCKYSRPVKNGKKRNQLTDEDKKKGADLLKENPKCKKCGAKMELKKGRFGLFLGCSNFPECKNMVGMMEKTGQKCPDCDKGDVIIRRTRRGKRFWGCSNYPKCKWASWKKPEL